MPSHHQTSIRHAQRTWCARVPGPTSLRVPLTSRAAARRRAQEQIGFDALLLCDDADLKELGLRKGVRVKILGKMRGWAASELARLG